MGGVGAVSQHSLGDFYTQLTLAEQEGFVVYGPRAEGHHKFLPLLAATACRVAATSFILN